MKIIYKGINLKENGYIDKQTTVLTLDKLIKWMKNNIVLKILQIIQYIHQPEGSTAKFQLKQITVV